MSSLEVDYVKSVTLKRSNTVITKDNKSLDDTKTYYICDKKVANVTNNN